MKLIDIVMDESRPLVDKSIVGMLIGCMQDYEIVEQVLLHNPGMIEIEVLDLIEEIEGEVI